ncbi:MAG: M1 family aminopeptidase [Acidobacteria bacterium]|nr:M1 family aminopeptidase [Acidobacteriota bacterium]
MVRNLRSGLGIGLIAILTAGIGAAQEQRERIDVQNYAIDATINPDTQSLTAVVKVQFTAVDNNVSSLAFELNNALSVSRVVNEAGLQIPASRSQQDFTVRLSLPQPLAKGKSETLTFTYDGRLTGEEESPVSGIKFAAIQNQYAYLLYPARWFPVNDYTVDRFTSDVRITVPAKFKVLASGNGTTETAAGGRTTYAYRYALSSFPGSIGVVEEAGQKVPSQGVTTEFYFRGASRGMAAAYGEEFGKAMVYLSSIFGEPAQKNLIVIETENGTPNGYAAPGLVFLSSRTIAKQVNQRVVANQIARQWWTVLVSAENRNHIWLTNGMARYAEILYLAHVNGPSAMDSEIKDAYIEALTVENPPLLQAGRLEDYSPEFWAATANKGAAVMNMLRAALGDPKFFQLTQNFPRQFAWKPVTTEDFRKTAEALVGEDLRWFFIQWIQSTGAPEFKMEYTVFRTQKGFRVMGKISQDLDTFRMPVELKIETEGNPEDKKVEVSGTSTEFNLDTFGKPKAVVIDPTGKVLRYSPKIRVAVAIRRGEQFAEIGDYAEALREYQKALDVTRNSSLAHYRVAEVFFLQNNYQSAANEFREALNGDLDPKWTEVWSHINLGKVFDITGQRQRALNEYRQAMNTKDNTQGAQEEAARHMKEPYKPKSTGGI